MDLLGRYALVNPSDPVFVMDPNYLRMHCRLDDGRFASPAIRGRLGVLNQLPMEILLNMLLKMDIPTLMSFRGTSRTAMGAVDSLREYQIINRLAPDFLRAALWTRAGFFNLEKLYNTLCATKCASCGHFGGYIYMITCERVCLRCFTRKKAYNPLSLDAAAFAARMSPEEVKERAAWIYPIWGFYGRGADTVMKISSCLVDRRQLETLSRRNFFSGLPGSCHLWNNEEQILSDPQPYLAIMEAPTIANGIVDWGLWCNECDGDEDEETHGDRQYSEDGLIEHILEHHE